MEDIDDRVGYVSHAGSFAKVTVIHLNKRHAFPRRAILVPFEKRVGDWKEWAAKSGHTFKFCGVCGNGQEI